MAICYSCKDELTPDNKSEEHIIKQSFRSSLKSPNLLCVKCNSEFGRSLDNDFSKELDYIAIALDSNTRNEKSITMYTETGEPTTVGPGLKARSFLKIERENKNIIIPNIPEDDLEKVAKRKKKELAKEGNYEFEKIQLPPASQRLYFHKEKRAKLGGETFFLSFLKIAINFYLYKNGDMKYVNYAIAVLKKDITDTKISRFFYPSLNKLVLEKDEICHFIYLKGDKTKKILFCYIELFSTHKVLVFLNDNYEGENIEEQYCYDIINKVVKRKDFTMNLSRNHYEDYQILPCNGQEEHQVLYTRLLEIIGNISSSQKG